LPCYVWQCACELSIEFLNVLKKCNNFFLMYQKKMANNN
jgi:hypothetical protein